MKLPHPRKRFVPYEAFEGVVGTIGQLVVNFAIIDQVLDCWLTELFPIAVKRNIASKMPFQLGHKIALIEKCLTHIKELAPIRTDAESLLKEISGYNWIRNTLAHGALSHYVEQPPSALVFTRLEYNQKKGVHILNDEIIPLAAISQATHLAANAIPELHAMFEAIEAIEFEAATS